MQRLKVPSKKQKSYRYMPGHELADDKGMVDTELLRKTGDVRSPSNAPYVFKKQASRELYNKFGKSANYIADEMSPTKHPSTGEVYTSKKKFRNETKARGCIEVGNETKIQPREVIETNREERKRDIHTAIQQLRTRQ